MTSTETAIYTAAYIDGEGSIQINPAKGTKGQRYWGLTIQVSSCCREVLDWLHQEWHMGSITEWNPKKGKRPSYNWRVYGSDAEQLLKSIRSYMKVKQEQCDTAIDFRKYVGTKRNSLTPEMIDIRRELAEKMRELNKRYGKGSVKHINVRNVI